MMSKYVPLQEFDNYVKCLRQNQLDNAVAKTDKNETDIQRFRSNQVDIDALLDIIYKLFESEGYIASDADDMYTQVDNVGPLTVDVKPQTKFRLLEHHPDYRGKENIVADPIVTIQIIKRTPSSMEQGRGAHSTESRRTTPRVRGFGQVNTVGGDYEEEQVMRFDNTIEFIAWSEQSKESRQITQLIEQLFIFKYYRKMRQYCLNFSFQTRGRPIYSDDYGQKRMFGTPIQFLVQTEENMLIQEQPINEISVTSQPI